MKKLIYIFTLFFIVSFSTTFIINLHSTQAKSIESNKKVLDENKIDTNNSIEETSIYADNLNSSPNSNSTDNEASVAVNILLVNKSNKLDSNYTPQNLKTSKVKAISYANSKSLQMDSEAATALEKLFAAALEDNITLLAVSGYRNYDYQKELYTKQVKQSGKKYADKYVAQPGFSEHQTGLAMDLLSTEYSTLDEGFEKTEAYKWLKENCAKYGFIIRYPKDKVDVTKYNFEPWHIRYVGLQASKEIMDKGIALEEYLDSINIKY